MLIFDRYVARMFVRVLLVSFLSLTGLFIVIDLFGNLDELISYAEREGSLLSVLCDYYGARIFSFFDRTSSLLALLAAIFTITWFQRSNELTAVMAAGISRARAIRVLVVGTIMVALLAAVNREVALPKMRDKLTRNAQDWLGEKAGRLNPRRDNRTNILLGGKAAVAARRRITQPSFRLPRSFSEFGRQLVAGEATYCDPTPEHPGGYLLEEVTQPQDLRRIDSRYQEVDGAPIILTPKDHTWLRDDQCFVASDVSFEYLAADATWQQYASTAELVSALRNPSLDYGADARVTVHRRLIQPVLDVTLLFLGLPLVLSRSHRNLFVAAAQCLLLVGAFFVVSLACQAMGSTVMIRPVLAAWLPLLIFTPLAYTAAVRKWE